MRPEARIWLIPKEHRDSAEVVAMYEEPGHRLFLTYEMLVKLGQDISYVMAVIQSEEGA